MLSDDAAWAVRTHQWVTDVEFETGEARIAVETVRSTPTEVELVRLVAFDEATHRLYAKLLKG